MIFGYARVSTKDQNVDRQIAALEAQGVQAIFVDKVSGKDFERAEYKRLLRKAKRGDCIVIKSIDRLGRNYQEIKDEWERIVKRKGINIRVLDMPLLNTENDKDNLTGVFIADIVLQILAYVAQTEREFIRQRQAEGIALAKARGVRFGAKRKPLPDDFSAYAYMYRKGTISIRQAAKELGVSSSLFYRRINEKDEWAY